MLMYLYNVALWIINVSAPLLFFHRRYKVYIICSISYESNNYSFDTIIFK